MMETCISMLTGMMIEMEEHTGLSVGERCSTLSGNKEEGLRGGWRRWIELVSKRKISNIGF